MLRRLLSDVEMLINNLIKHRNRIGDEFKEKAVADLLFELIRSHRKVAWHLRAHLDGDDVAQQTASSKGTGTTGTGTKKTGTKEEHLRAERPQVSGATTRERV